MAPTLHFAAQPAPDAHLLVLLSSAAQLDQLPLEPAQADFARQQLSRKAPLVTLQRLPHLLFLALVPEKGTQPLQAEAARQAGFSAHKTLKENQIEELQLQDLTAEGLLLPFTEGLVLTDYTFTRHKTAPEGASGKNGLLRSLTLSGPNLTEAWVTRLQHLLEAVYLTRDLVNEPANFLTAQQLSAEIVRLGALSGFTTEVLDQIRIESLKMGGLLAVNQGSQDPPTFTIMEYRPEKPANAAPVILVGKGVVFDTGGLSLKPTPASMDMMKCDMAGAAAVVGAFYAAAKSQLPVHLIGLIPATDNRIGENAISPSDVITMYSGKTVEVMNTDAEGRLILADALCFAAKYHPALVIDLATLTGAAARAIGKEGIVMMGTAADEVKGALAEAGRKVHERLVEFPLWEEYGKYIESDVADIKNLGTADAGAISAGKFLEHFTTYPWIHLDIAGPAFLTGTDSYRGKNGTGTGVRLLYQFLKDHVAAHGEAY